ncbi:outer membrane protein assembly factor BamB family protein [Halorhabdus rudnickae]|uniref:outer membrane protein assembly factor BamB family protein n=1 Tax=Halorhabdus rudnickae TaxID=1775544 RepID=UPI00143834BD|nr:PQQ-binding-like beta-propeller repeat protein [Halorhabdus rudnickae]
MIGLTGITSIAGCSLFNSRGGPNVQPPDSLGTTWSPSADAWSFPYADVKNTARSPHRLQTLPIVTWQDHVTPDNPGSQISGELIAATPNQVISAVRFDHEIQLRAYDAVDGTRRWHRRIQYPSGLATPQFGGLVEDIIYLTDGSTDVIAINEADGKVHWRWNLYERVADEVPSKFLSAPDSPFLPLPFATPETVYVQSSYGVHGLAPEDGAEQWRIYLGRQTDEMTLGYPFGLAVTDRRIWASYGGGVQSVFTIELADGNPEINRIRLPLSNPSSPVVTSGSEAVLTNATTWATRPEKTLAVGVTEDGGMWQFPGHAGEGASAYSSLATDNKRVFICECHAKSERLVVFALRAATGKLEWVFRKSLAQRDVSVGAGREFRLSQPAVTGDSLLVGYGNSPYAATGEGEIIALSRTGGDIQWRTDLPVAPRYLAMTNNGLYVGGQQGSVVALADDDSE